VESQQGKGTTFEIHLPLQRKAEVQNGAEAATSAA
jgi:signal transduction histidine kinase